MTKLLTSGILFPITVNAELVTKPLILGISLSISLILELSLVFLTRPLVSENFCLHHQYFFSKFDLSVLYLVFKTNPLVLTLFTLATNLSNTVFLTTSFLTTWLSLFKSAVFNLSTSILPISAFKQAKSYFAINLDVSTPIAFLKSVFVHNWYFLQMFFRKVLTHFIQCLFY